MRTGGSLADFSAAQASSLRDKNKARTISDSDRARILCFTFCALAFSVGSEEPETRNPRRKHHLGGQLETRNPTPETYLRIGVVNAFELGQLEAHHVACGGSHQFLIPVGVGVPRDRLGGHRRMFLIDFAVDNEKGSGSAV
jgi:hypothetical protein